MYVIRYENLKQAIDPVRKLVKLSDPNLWKQSWPEGTQNWQIGHEIRSEALGISMFTSGTTEKLHFHERTWELYQVLEGSLRFAVKRFRKDSWQIVTLKQHDMLLLIPGTLHLVDSNCTHKTQVIQAPPALSDHILVDDPKEILGAEDILRNNLE
ncbi:MAG: hypothetical protein DRR16_29890 [Candidatus Parabeggiatoa sp. nov. 3]|nr:MAG: hypothetical protein DRR00_23340 [Gammaproteobacteria bacterium]RKZ55865.1 MAG: hypothetical protein DRQ99_29425 [Gammaproteobacteria bacterium]RKZ77141.1 MAG: hypothetical protein DRR16_29890 [Gammaproteobacteria bacterium]